MCSTEGKNSPSTSDGVSRPILASLGLVSVGGIRIVKANVLFELCRLLLCGDKMGAFNQRKVVSFKIDLFSDPHLRS